MGFNIDRFLPRGFATIRHSLVNFSIWAGNDLLEYQIINRNCTKLSYSTMKNMKRHIDSHNRKILEKEKVPEETRTCNCRRKDECPLDGNCLVKEIVYSADIETTQKVMTYYGLTERTFKERYNQHQSDFRHAKHRFNTNSASMSTHWRMLGLTSR